MNNNETRTLWISVAAAIFAAFLLYSYTNEKTAELTKQYGAKKQVVVAKTEIQEMETIDESMLEIVERPTEFVEPKAITDPELAVGQVALAPISPKEQILETKVMRPGPTTGLAGQITPSKRALTLPVDEVRGVAKLLKPGDRVDLIAAIDVGSGANRKKEIKTIMQDVPVLATGLKVVNELPRLYEKVGKDDFIKNIRSDTSYSSITIEADPKDAQRIVYILATSPGSLYMTLRHPTDRNKGKMPTSNVTSVLDKPRPSTLVPKMKPARQPAATPRKKKRKKKSGPFIEL